MVCDLLKLSPIINTMKSSNPLAVGLYYYPKVFTVVPQVEYRYIDFIFRISCSIGR